MESIAVVLARVLAHLPLVVLVPAPVPREDRPTQDAAEERKAA